jgi:hypothetical protein
MKQVLIVYMTHVVCVRNVNGKISGSYGMKVAVLWDVAPLNLGDTDGRFRGAYCLSSPR